MEVIGVNSKSVVHRFFQQLIEGWFLEKKQGVYYPTVRLGALPLFESIRAWFPTTVTDETRYDISIESYLVDNPSETILLKVVGDSMIDAGFLEGDIVVVDTSMEADVGQVIVGVVDDEYTMKFYMKDKKGNYFLQAANQHVDYPDIYPQEELRIFGVVVGSFRKLI